MIATALVFVVCFVAFGDRQGGIPRVLHEHVCHVTVDGAKTAASETTCTDTYPVREWRRG